MIHHLRCSLRGSKPEGIIHTCRESGMISTRAKRINYACCLLMAPALLLHSAVSTRAVALVQPVRMSHTWVSFQLGTGRVSSSTAVCTRCNGRSLTMHKSLPRYDEFPGSLRLNEGRQSNCSKQVLVERNSRSSTPKYNSTVVRVHVCFCISSYCMVLLYLYNTSKALMCSVFAECCSSCEVMLSFEVKYGVRGRRVRHYRVQQLLQT